ncbi:class I SAM-dependent methyltransferase [Fluviispira vulneris]|uniref:class I SAM-dependent methyltransferase n=1 Tax=Fluviispira vulneris TaxID=2763012 RepID=UPI001648B696|nr:methyltransferase domain-containing protein [Fluviispira vulneris]
MKKLDLGCGNSKKEGYIGVDSLSLKNVDIIHNLDRYPYPFDENEIDEIIMDNVLEHLSDPVKVLEEIYRISKNGANIIISVPYFRSVYAYIDPTHRNFFSSFWFDYFDPTNIYFEKYAYAKVKFRVKKIEFDKEFKKERIRFWHRIMIYIAEKHRVFYEMRLSHLFPLNSITFELRVIK